MAETYTVKIMRTSTVEKLRRGDWCVVRTEKEAEAMTDEEVKATASRRGQYGYAPDRVVSVSSTEEIYSQEVPTLDVSALVRFINGGDK